MDWPFFDLRLTYRNVVVRAVTDADLPRLMAIHPADAEQNPAALRFDWLDSDSDRRRLFLQGVWANRGQWSPSSWCLDLVVEVDDEVVGVQSLEGEDFPLLRTVDSASWLSSSARGRGTATAMRTAILALAFGSLGAVAAVSSAEPANVASMAVSRRLGYVANGVSRINSPHGVVELEHLRLTSERWLAERHRVDVFGAEACLPWFGLT